MKQLLAGSLLALCCATAVAQAADQTLEFSLDRPGPPMVRYTLVVHDNGTGTFVSPAGSGQAANAPGVDPKQIRISPAVVKILFAAVPMVEGGRCETHAKGIAKTGIKQIRYVGAGREAQCSFNYSDEQRLGAATDAFQAIAETMRYGERLAAELRFDRLGLDAELENLQSALAEKRALEVDNIAPVLKAIDQDERVMERVHRKVEQLLQSSQTAAGSEASVR